MRRVLVTGATGFVGRVLCPMLRSQDWDVVTASRRGSGQPREVIVGEIGSHTNWRDALDGVDTIIHLAARVHVMQESERNPLDAFMKVNALGTERLARTAAEMGVKRLVLVSTVKVNGEATITAPFTEEMPPAPEDPYGQSKLEAEKALWKVAEETGLEGVVIRPPLVYGPGVKGNFQSLLGLVNSGLPLPLGNCDNRRSLVYVDNLSSALCLVAEHPEASGNIFLVSDREDLSTSDLIRRTAIAIGKRPRLFPFPHSLLLLAGLLTGKTAMIERLTGSLQIDPSKIVKELGWLPPFNVNEGLKRTANSFLSSRLSSEN